MSKTSIYLKESATGKLVKAALLDEIADAHLAMWVASWCSEMERHCAGRILQNKPEDHHWDWKAKAAHWRPLLGYHSFAIVCQGELQGLMMANDLQSARLPIQFGKALVYVEYLATAPWNRSEVQMPPRFSGVGTTFISAAIELSRTIGYRGRIGLHALPMAESFYLEKCKMDALGRDTACQSLMYFELTEEKAELFRQDGRNR
jgi:hypothetical protein